MTFGLGGGLSFPPFALTPMQSDLQNEIEPVERAWYWCLLVLSCHPFAFFIYDCFWLHLCNFWDLGLSLLLFCLSLFWRSYSHARN